MIADATTYDYGWKEMRTKCGTEAGARNALLSMTKASIFPFGIDVYEQQSITLGLLLCTRETLIQSL
jgi:hypothetical protein